MLLSDLWLVQRARQGDSGAFGKLFDRHGRRVYHLLRRLSGSQATAEDLTQETFLTAWQRLESWKGRGALSTWLYGIAVNHWRTYRRSNPAPADSLSLPENAELPSDDDQADPLLHCTRAELHRNLDAAIATLPEVYREVFVLVRVEELSYQAVAELLDLPVGTVQSRLHRATGLLRKALTSTIFPEREKENCHVL
ncbi:MAG: sigma-70 family RNA polymerase sigma factor [Armatimonas sp.]